MFCTFCVVFTSGIFDRAQFPYNSIKSFTHKLLLRAPFHFIMFGNRFEFATERYLTNFLGLRPKLERRKPVTGPHPQLKKRPLQVIEVNQSSNGGQSTSLSADKNRISTLKIFFEEKDRKSKHESLILSGHYLEAQSTLLQPERFPLPLDKTCTKDRSSLEKWATTGLRFKSKAMALQFITSCG